MNNIIITDEDCDKLQVTLYNISMENIFQHLDLDLRTKRRNDAIKQWVKDLINKNNG